MFSRDAENSSRGIVAPSANATDEFVAERVFTFSPSHVKWKTRSAPRRG